ncbi:MAG: hypothetical protein LBT60_07785 [Oscillospiraceae bacterium]|jgi:predicted DsbA family dithiol-disulfide isomerase|nr:hypothetical protein [Oscillospiraceae bacterium]
MELEIFYDYACPYCMRNYDFLPELLSARSDITPVWRPCEAHPKPEVYSRYSELLVQCFFFAQAAGVDLWAFHTQLYRAALVDRIDIEDIDALAAYLGGTLDSAALTRALRDGVYAPAQRQNNDYAYEENDVWALPSYRMAGRKLDSVEGVGVSRAQFEAFLAEDGGH